MHIKRLMRTSALAVVAIGAALTGLVGASAPAQAASNPTPAVHSAAVRPQDGGVWTVVNGPVVWYNSANASRDANPSGSFTNGEQLDLACYEFGGPAGPYGDPLWYLTYTGQGFEFINDHYLNTPGTAAHPSPQGLPCFGPGYGDAYPFGPYYSAVGSAIWSNEPSTGFNTDFGFGNGDQMSLYCYTYGGAAGPYNNILWYLADDTTNHTYGWVNDHYLSTPDTAANPIPEAPPCSQTY